MPFERQSSQLNGGYNFIHIVLLVLPTFWRSADCLDIVCEPLWFSETMKFSAAYFYSRVSMVQIKIDYIIQLEVLEAQATQPMNSTLTAINRSMPKPVTAEAGQTTKLKQNQPYLRNTNIQRGLKQQVTLFILEDILN